MLFDSLTNLHSSFGFGAYTTHATPTADPFRPYVCHTCGKRFKLNHHLKQHSRIHTGERPFACNLCGKTFTQQSSYHYHIKKMLCGPSVAKLDVTVPSRNQSSGNISSGNIPEMPLQSRLDTGVALSGGMQSDVSLSNLLVMNLTEPPISVASGMHSVSGSAVTNTSGLHSDLNICSGIPTDTSKVNVTLPSIAEPTMGSGTTYDTTMTLTSAIPPDIYESTDSHS